MVDKLINNLVSNISFLKSDFVGFNFKFEYFFAFLVNFLFAIFIFFLLYFFGKKINRLVFDEHGKFEKFINLSLGYTVFGTIIAFLGFFSLLKKEVILSFLLFSVLFAAGSFDLKQNFIKIKEVLRINLKFNFKKISFVQLAILFFILISFLKLISPDIAEDGYHTDLAVKYVNTGTSMHESRDLLHATAYPQLAEMIYIIPNLFSNKETSRFIHFFFYITIVALLVEFSKKNKFAYFAPLLFVTAPVVIRYASTQYTDFYMVFCFLVSAFLIKKAITMKTLLLAGVIFGAVLSTKVWTLVYLPAFVLYIIFLNSKASLFVNLKNVSAFIGGALSIVLVWYIRAFVITGNPIYPVFAKFELLEVNSNISSPIAYYFSPNFYFLSIPNMIVFSPFFFFAAALCIFSFKNFYNVIKKSSLFILFLIISVEQLVVKVDLGRYLVAWYALSIIFLSWGLDYFYKNTRIVRLTIVVGVIIMGFYYFASVLLVLPYGLGFADENKYLTRVLYRDNVSYYDFDHLFSKHIGKNDLVATYLIGNFYYANFYYVDVNYIFDLDHRSFSKLKESKATKLLIKGGDIKWFCKQLSLTACDYSKVKLLATYPTDIKKFNLYEIK